MWISIARNLCSLYYKRTYKKPVNLTRFNSNCSSWDVKVVSVDVTKLRHWNRGNFLMVLSGIYVQEVA